MGHTITFMPSGRRIDCPPDSTILAAGLQAGVGLPFSCRSGVCRTCRGRLQAGEVDFGPVHPAYLSEAEKVAGFAHLCQARPRTDCTVEVAEFDPAQSFPSRVLPVRLMSVHLLAPDVARLQLGLPPNEPLRFHAGQYVELLLEDGARRCYSIANAPEPDGVRQIELHLRHMAGGRFTPQVFDGALAPRRMLRMEAPRGCFFLHPGGEGPRVLLASGTGFAPLKAIVEDRLAQGDDRPLHLYWGGRRRTDLYLDSLASQWAAEHPHIRYTPVLSDPSPDCNWTGRTGFVHRAVLQDHPDLRHQQVYACGAPAMVDAARRDFTEAGLPADAFFADAFVSQADLRPELPSSHPDTVTA
jgi:CDP-4-dehydro-6-deoxyglucose reductase